MGLKASLPQSQAFAIVLHLFPKKKATSAYLSSPGSTLILFSLRSPPFTAFWCVHMSHLAHISRVMSVCQDVSARLPLGGYSRNLILVTYENLPGNQIFETCSESKDTSRVGR